MRRNINISHINMLIQDLQVFSWAPEVTSLVIAIKGISKHRHAILLTN